MLSLFIMSFALAAQGPESAENVDVPVRSKLAYGVISGTELVLCQIKDKEIQWFSATCSGEYLKMLTVAHPELESKFEFAKMFGLMPLSGRSADGKSPVHRYRVGFGYLWIVKLHGIPQSGGAGLYRLGLSGTSPSPDTIDLLKSLPDKHRQRNVGEVVGVGQVENDAGLDITVDVGGIGFLLSEAMHVRDSRDDPKDPHPKHSFDVEILPLAPDRVVLSNGSMTSSLSGSTAFSECRRDRPSLRKSREPGSELR